MTRQSTLLETIADYHLGNIDATEWLQCMAELAGCKAVHIINWATGRPETAVTYSSAEPIEIDAAWLAWVDRLVQTSNPEQPDLLEDIVQSGDVPANNLLADLN